jgi:Ti-type conjugative transfer relaxase TraA
LTDDTVRWNAAKISQKPDMILSIVTGEKSVFDQHDVARALHRTIDDQAAFQPLFAAIMASPVLVELQPADPKAPNGGTLARYSTTDMVALEGWMSAVAAGMAARHSHAVNAPQIDHGIEQLNITLRQQGAVAAAPAAHASAVPGLTDEQVAAVRHVTKPSAISAVVGYAGAGKSTMLAAARNAWESAGYRVAGAALAGKAAEGLQLSSDIAARTLASWEASWLLDRDKLGPKDVLVIDEAGMIGSRQLQRFVEAAQIARAKLVLVGDNEQLQAIGAGAPFRAIVEQIGVATLQDIRRQRHNWQRAASVAFARHDTAAALQAYDSSGAIRHRVDRDKALAGLVRDYLDDLVAHPDGSRVALAHRRADVHDINLRVRSARKGAGDLAEEDVAVVTRDGERAFATGDRLVLLENNRDMNVRNGMLGTVRAVSSGSIDVQLDADGTDTARRVHIDAGTYNAFDHGYALTIHKTQGATVDRALVFASATMDRHLTYVAMTRHREAAALYVDRQEFANRAALLKRLGRDGSKETTLDYVEAFKARRGIGGMIDRVIERVKAVPQRLVEVVETVRSKVTTGRTLRPLGQDAEKPFRDGLDRLAIAYVDVLRMDGKPATYQTVRLQKACSDLERVKPGALATLRSAMEQDPQALTAVMAHKGTKRVGGMIAAIAREQSTLFDPDVRAQRFVRRWCQQQPAYVALHGDYRRIEECKVAERKLHGLAEELAADKPMAAAIHVNPTRFGLELHMPLATALRTNDPVRALKISIEHGFAAPSRGYSR